MKKLIIILICTLLLAGCRNDFSFNKSNEEIIDSSSSSELSGKLILSVPIYVASTKDYVEAFKKTYPNIEVEVRSVINDDNYYDWDLWGTAFNEYVSQMAVDIMSGSDVDIYETCYLSFYKYANSESFENLYTYMENDSSINTEDYYMNILDAFSVEDKLCLMPANISYDLLRINRSYFPKADPDTMAIDYKELAKLYDLAKTSDIDFSYKDSGHFDTFSRNEFLSYIDPFAQKVNFDSPDFLDFLSFSKNTLSWSEIKKPRTDYTSYMDWEKPWLINMFSFDLFSLSEDTEFVSQPLLLCSSKGNRGFSPKGGIFSISSFSKNKQLAWAFIKFMIEEKDYPFEEYSLSDYGLQIETYISMVPVNRNNFIKRATRILGERYDRDVSKEVNYWDALNKSLNSVLFVDINAGRITDELKNEFSKGRLTNEEYASQLQERLQIYYNE